MSKYSRGNPKPLPDLELLKSLFEYFPATGELIHRWRPIHYFSNKKQTREHTYYQWNSRYAGKTACTNKYGKDDPYLYVYVPDTGEYYSAHRIMYYMHTGIVPDEVDHDNGNTRDNRADNLNNVSQVGNARNYPIPSNNSSGTIGIYFNKNEQKWHARIGDGVKQHHLGYFEDLDDAVAARLKAEKELGYNTNHGRG